MTNAEIQSLIEEATFDYTMGETDAALAKLTLDQVNAALRKYLKPGDFAAAYAGDFKP